MITWSVWKLYSSKKKIYPPAVSDQSLLSINYLCVIGNGEVSIKKPQQSEYFDFCLEVES